jgi:hypothetical protein
MLGPTPWITGFGRGYGLIIKHNTGSMMYDPPPEITNSVSVNGCCFDYCLVAVVMLSCANIFTI